VFDNDANQFTPGLYARIKLVGSGTYPAALIKDDAVGTDLGKKFVLVMDKDSKVQYRSIELGPKLEGLRIVRNGLTKGDRIVINGLQRVRPGAQVDAQNVEMASQATLATLAHQRQALAQSEAPKVAEKSPAKPSAPRS